ncbi:uncharacterized protein LOC110690188 isoform X2 [Chenopodium quinoa]|uniref:uncharacterized protein LOC110690188 isoform X2 n=1 Tax=Chenopodium quinoa TaxID=63459 RepID=UPI000B786CE1|nr:uncharacterized protein LOC110690188 isoform X2 [Chenopodium quinoa]
MEGNYSQDLLPSLAPPPCLPEIVRHRGKVVVPPQSVRYLEPISITEDYIVDVSKSFRQAHESLPDVFDPLMHSDMMGFMRLVDALKYYIIKFRRGASCRGGSGDVLEE